VRAWLGGPDGARGRGRRTSAEAGALAAAGERARDGRGRGRVPAAAARAPRVVVLGVLGGEDARRPRRVQIVQEAAPRPRRRSAFAPHARRSPAGRCARAPHRRSRERLKRKPRARRRLGSRAAGTAPRRVAQRRRRKIGCTPARVHPVHVQVAITREKSGLADGRDRWRGLLRPLGWRGAPRSEDGLRSDSLGARAHLSGQLLGRKLGRQYSLGGAADGRLVDRRAVVRRHAVRGRSRHRHYLARPPFRGTKVADLARLWACPVGGSSRGGSGGKRPEPARAVRPAIMNHPEWPFAALLGGRSDCTG
jgi:hypothetical protein